MTAEEAKSLKIGDVVWNVVHRNKNGSPGKWLVCCEDRPFRDQTEAERQYPYRVRVMIKRRFGEWDRISELELDQYSLGNQP